MNFFLKLLSNITEKIANKAYVKFCDGKYHWALVETSCFDAENRLVYKKNIAEVWNYNYSGHKIVACSKDVCVRTITTIYSDDSQRIIYKSEDIDGDVKQETWYEYNEQNKLVKTKTINMYNAHSSICTFVDYEYNQKGFLEKTIETSEKDGKKNEGYVKVFYNEKGLETKRDEYIVSDRLKEYISMGCEYNEANNLVSDSVDGHTLSTYQYDSQNNLIRKIDYDGRECLYKTIIEKDNELTIKKDYVYHGQKVTKNKA